ncbi:nucleoside triphosphate pyrophosphohydrolase family protein [Cytobacillus kochii]|uniref:nucleoside triphosphate pyrophosphohydrolase family protein n=1 Tax=Cytobacillus kochii TaxID=859143 RepID=UPI001CD4EF00|nr:nucleoside triphosphate pyrophosphohydrolase family protein [Cytobacillus kochii]MCA1029308.1 nucleoside triphosphate pyrophosphohydrolase family protein [Cytobacillus kochii]
MKLNDYQLISKRTMPSVYDERAKTNYAMGLCGEAGEVTDLIKKELFHGHEEDREKIKKELGDVLHYLAGVADMYGWTLEQVATANIEKLMKRFPNGFNKVDSIKRVDVGSN